MRLEDRTLDLLPQEGARVLVLGLLAEASEASAALAAGAGDEPLHDFRVSIRRLRSALRALRPWLADGVRPRHERKLKKLAQSTNEARDAEVQLAWLATKRDELGVRRQAGFDAIVRRLEARAHTSPDAARVTERFGRTAERLRRRLHTYERTVAPDGEGGPSFGAVLASLVREQVEALAERMAAVQGPADQEGVHRARIEGKRLRYLLEPLKGYRAADAAEVIGNLKALQDLLGELHDAHVLAGELRDALAESAAGRAHLVHDAVFAHGSGGHRGREPLPASPRSGILALVRLLRDRRDGLYAALERDWRPAGMETLAAEAHAVAAALEARAGGKIEHERKYLLTALPPRASEDPGVEIAQGWLPGGQLRERVRRVRHGGRERYWRAIKRGTGGVRLEAEEETSRELFEGLWPLTEGRRVAKRRHRVEDGALVWELDAFTDRELFLAEVELPATAGEVQLPEWLRPFVARDVTDDPAYRNEALAAAPGSTSVPPAAPPPPAAEPAGEPAGTSGQEPGDPAPPEESPGS